MLLKDIRDYQILFLSLFLVLGIGTRDWTLRPDLILVAIATCLLTQWVAERAASIWPHLKVNIQNLFAQSENHSPKLNLDLLNPQKHNSLRSAAITALSLCLLLRAEHYTTMIVAGILAISSKFIFQIGHKHFFNPANFGIIAALIFTKDAWVSPGQWGEDWWYALLFVGGGGMILKRIGRWDTTAAFLGSYALLEAIRNIWLGSTWDVYFHRLMSGSLLLFALFMITDPRSIPNAKISRLIWAASIALLTFILRNYFFVSTAVFWALFALAPLTILLDYLWTAPRFKWSLFRSQLSLDLSRLG
ncbi:RnfABCDGE type electron transport complex subunit D [Argonema galeatum]|uniref:RnfABCDGE type electron transport complex subunit D n=1 Tax=Argonema galeatum TaxID=2942762 RepID=UPI002012BB1C|nr:RnfABCDGE type electron transport complex subunit D [Argonema galeatum]MCL1469002.1 RnfABCDGE type electron transport complex subunit D [Argonema galeatum A003/A1]